MTWWLWLIVGFVLIGFEVVIPSHFFVFFCGVGAVLVGLVYLALPELTLGAQFLLWSILSIALIAILRKKLDLGDKLDGSDRDTLVGKIATATSDMDGGSVGRGELRGSGWSLKNVGEKRIAAGAQCTVVAVDGLTLNVISN